MHSVSRQGQTPKNSSHSSIADFVIQRADGKNSKVVQYEAPTEKEKTFLV